jgi:hypothetical protein
MRKCYPCSEVLNLTDTRPDGSQLLRTVVLWSRRTASQVLPGQRHIADGSVQFRLLGFLRLHLLLFYVLDPIDVQARGSAGPLQH